MADSDDPPMDLSQFNGRQDIPAMAEQEGGDALPDVSAMACLLVRLLGEGGVLAEIGGRWRYIPRSAWRGSAAHAAGQAACLGGLWQELQAADLLKPPVEVSGAVSATTIRSVTALSDRGWALYRQLVQQDTIEQTIGQTIERQ